MTDGVSAALRAQEQVVIYEEKVQQFRKNNLFELCQALGVNPLLSTECLIADCREICGSMIMELSEHEDIEGKEVNVVRVKLKDYWSAEEFRDFNLRTSLLRAYVFLVWTESELGKKAIKKALG
jgi:hypothetical protein